MCGIYGTLELKPARRVAEETLFRMGDTVIHRGPDDYGHFCRDEIAMGIRRLSIIDLEGGHQPIGNEDGTVWAVCNGEIYNFRELRRELEARGHVFGCRSDSEVIVHLYEEEGTDLFRRLRGMFGIAIWDVRRSRLVLARDRLGKKPLYVLKERDRLLFASEIKSILEVASESAGLNMQALPEYLALGYVPAPQTLFAGIEKLLPGHYMTVEKGCIEVAEYWNIPSGPIEERPEEEWIEAVREKLVESIQVRLVSDVPLGAFLSGGIDSSTIVATMARLGDQPVKTYSIGFESNDSFYNELPYAGIIAREFGTDHREIVVRPDVAGLLPDLIWHLEEPLADSAFITTYLVAKFAAEDVKVILSGVGGDELFGGYRRYLGGPLAAYYRWLPPVAREKWLPGIVDRLPQDRHTRLSNYARYASAFIKSAEADPAARYMSYVSLFSPQLQHEMFGHSKETGTSDFVSSAMKESFDQSGNLTELSRLIYVDLKTSLPDDLLALTDKMTMAASLECRAPFVDHELVELTTRIPDSLKISGFRMKYLLKKAVQPWLPDGIVNRPKRGFGAPMGAWLRNELRPLVGLLLSESQVRKRGLFNWPRIQQMIASHEARHRDYTDQLLALINLELWCQMFLDGRSRRDCAEMMEIGTHAR